MGKIADSIQRRCLTPSENTNIIDNLCAEEAKEKKLAYQVVGLQAAITLIIAGIAYSLSDVPQHAMAVLGGGLISVSNGALLAWRMSRAALQSTREAHHQLRFMYFYAAERFLAVVVLLGLCMAVLKLSPPALLGGFVMGQAILLSARLFISKINKIAD